jgi:hypothetical protein
MGRAGRRVPDREPPLRCSMPQRRIGDSGNAGTKCPVSSCRSLGHACREERSELALRVCFVQAQRLNGRAGAWEPAPSEQLPWCDLLSKIFNVSVDELDRLGVAFYLA